MVIGDDVKAVMSRTPEENCWAFPREIIEFVRPERYLTFVADVERTAGAEQAEPRAVLDAGRI